MRSKLIASGLMGRKKRRKRMTTAKKAFITATAFCILLVVFSAVMIVLDKDTMTVSVFGGAGVACIPILFGIYDKYSNEISLKHMEMNYDPNYDENQGHR